MRQVPFAELVGKTLTRIDGCVKGSWEVVFQTTDGTSYKMFHEQDCCEVVSVEDVCGDVEDMIGTPIVMAEESDSWYNPPDVTPDNYGTFTWTFYKLATIKGYLTIRWYGESNGYYSEEVTFEKSEERDDENPGS